MTKKTKQPSSHFKDLALLFSIPIGVSLLAAAIVYVPRMMANPTYDFVYSYCDDYDCVDPYSAESDGEVTKEAVKTTERYSQYGSEAKLGYYEAKTGAVRVISYEGAQRYQLSTSSVSPEGYSLTNANDDGGLLFGGSSDRQWYLQDGLKKKPVKLAGPDQYYSSSNDINFLGWVKR